MKESSVTVSRVRTRKVRTTSWRLGALDARKPSGASSSRSRTLSFCDRVQRLYLLTRIKVVSTSNPISQPIADISHGRRNGSCGDDHGRSSYEYSITDIAGSFCPGAYDTPGMQTPPLSHAEHAYCLAGWPPPILPSILMRAASCSPTRRSNRS